MQPTLHPDSYLRRIMIAFWMIALLLGAIQAWSSRFDMAPDGIQYLDNADAYFRGDWANAANTQWSPMYAWLLGAALKILKPSAYWEFPVVHLVNFLVYVCALGAFQLFLSTLLRRTLKPGVEQRVITVVACSAFLYAMLDFTNIVNPTPDLTMAVFVFLLAALLVKILLMGDRGLTVFLVIGLVMGGGYLAKAPFFVFAGLLLGILALLALRGKIGIANVMVAAAAFLVIAAPYIAFLSSEKGRLTYGDSGRYNMIWMVNGVPYYDWQGGSEGNGMPLHPTRELSARPEIYEFAAPIIGTYPPWYDPIYWNEGAKFHFRPMDFVRAVVLNSRVYFWLFHHRQTPLICGLIILFVSARPRLLAIEFLRFWPVLAFAAFPFVMYVAVHADGRFLGAFFTLLWTALFGVAILSAQELPVKVVKVVCGSVAILMLIEAALVTVPTPPLTGTQDQTVAPRSRHAQQDIASALSQLGIQPGDHAAIIGNDLPYFWARLARVQIMAQMLPKETQYSPKTQRENAAEWIRGREILATTPAHFVISPAIAGVVDQPGWERVGSTEAFIYRLVP